MKTQTKKFLVGLTTFSFCLGLIWVSAPQASARMVFSTEEGSTNADSYTIDYDDSAGTGDVILRFGTTVDKSITYDNANTYFKINDDVSFEENQALKFRIENNAGVVAVCNASRYGRLYYDSGDSNAYVCTSAGWKSLTGLSGFAPGDFLRSNTSDVYESGTMTFTGGTTLDVNGTLDADGATVNLNGITNNTLMLDEDNTGGDVVLQFGQSLAEAIKWDNANSRFDISDDLYVNGNLTVTGTIGGTFNGTFNGTMGNDTVTTNSIQNYAVTANKIGTGAVTNNALGSQSVTANKIANNTITATQIGTNAVGSDELTDNAVDTNSIQNYAVTSGKIGTGAVTTTHIADGTIADIDINNSANISFSKLATRNKSTLISPEYPNYTLYADGSNNSGTLDADRDAANQKNYYSWSSRNTALNDYDILVQFQVPEDFSSWQANAINFNYKTEETGTGDNNVQVYILDTAGASAYTGAALASTSADTWTSTNVTSVNISGGTFTAGSYMTVGIKLSSRRDNGSASGDPRSAYAGELKLNYVGR